MAHPSERHTTLYDTTLRDGMQREGVSLSVDDKLRIAARLDEAGIPFIEGGFPGATPKDRAFFDALSGFPLQQAHIVAFGTVAKGGHAAADDPALQLLAATAVDFVTLVAKASRLQVEQTLRITPEENLTQVRDSLQFLRAAGKHVFLDLEHYFDGVRTDAAYAHAVITAAVEAGAEQVCLCDTNGGALPFEIPAVVAQACAVVAAATPAVPCAVGTHFHNDTGCGVANALMAVEAGATCVQGSINGIGERTGNTDLIAVMATLALKMGDTCCTAEHLRGLTALGHFIAETLNLAPDPYQPYIGSSAFAHKGGIHASGIERMSGAYEHVDPRAVGNLAKIVVSELAGRASLRLRAEELGYTLTDEEAARALTQIKDLENKGYSFEAADASLALMLERQAGTFTPTFTLESFRVIAEKREDGRVMTEATVKIHVDGKRYLATAEGNGPVNALDRALRKAIGVLYPALGDIALTDYKVRVLDEHKGTDAVTRVLIESGDATTSWGTVGVSENIIEASWEALVDSIDYGLTKDAHQPIQGSHS